MDINISWRTDDRSKLSQSFSFFLSLCNFLKHPTTSRLQLKLFLRFSSRFPRKRFRSWMESVNRLDCSPSVELKFHVRTFSLSLSFSQRRWNIPRFSNIRQTIRESFVFFSLSFLFFFKSFSAEITAIPTRFQRYFVPSWKQTIFLFLPHFEDLFCLTSFVRESCNFRVIPRTCERVSQVKLVLGKVESASAAKLTDQLFFFFFFF